MKAQPCSVKWCSALAEKGDKCRVHAKHPELHPEPGPYNEVNEECSFCEGSGECQKCSGDGECDQCGATCSGCDGDGNCHHCDGTGFTKEMKASA